MVTKIDVMTTNEPDPHRLSSGPISSPNSLASPNPIASAGLLNQRSSRRLYDRYSAPNAEEKYSQFLTSMNGTAIVNIDDGTGIIPSPRSSFHEDHRSPRTSFHEDHRSPRTSFHEDPHRSSRSSFHEEQQLADSYKRSSASSMRGMPSQVQPSSRGTSLSSTSPLLRTKPPNEVNDVVSNANWSVVSPTIGSGERSSSLRPTNETFQNPRTSFLAPPPTSSHGHGARTSSLSIDDAIKDINNLSVRPPQHVHYAHPVSPIVISPPSPAKQPIQLPQSTGSTWSSSDGHGMKASTSGYATSELSDADDYHEFGEFTTTHERVPSGTSHKEKGKIPESIDLEVVKGK